MSLSTILLVILILMLLGVIPVWPHSRSWGYKPNAVKLSSLPPLTKGD